MKKRSKRVGAQISGSTKDQFAGENEVCKISQKHKKGYEITSQQKADFAALRSWLSAAVFGFQRDGKLQGEMIRLMVA